VTSLHTDMSTRAQITLSRRSTTPSTATWTSRRHTTRTPLSGACTAHAAARRCPRPCGADWTPSATATAPGSATGTTYRRACRFHTEHGHLAVTTHPRPRLPGVGPAAHLAAHPGQAARRPAPGRQARRTARPDRHAVGGTPRPRTPVGTTPPTGRGVPPHPRPHPPQPHNGGPRAQDPGRDRERALGRSALMGTWSRAHP
jgi:hypothetical protein